VVPAAQVRKGLDELARAVAKRSAERKEALTYLVERIILTPGPDGYTAKLTLRYEQAALPREAACSLRLVAGAGFEPATVMSHRTRAW
jgi:hypothetical protein